MSSEEELADQSRVFSAQFTSCVAQSRATREKDIPTKFCPLLLSLEELQLLPQIKWESGFGPLNDFLEDLCLFPPGGQLPGTTSTSFSLALLWGCFEWKSQNISPGEDLPSAVSFRMLKLTFLAIFLIEKEIWLKDGARMGLFLEPGKSIKFFHHHCFRLSCF